MEVPSGIHEDARGSEESVSVMLNLGRTCAHKSELRAKKAIFRDGTND